MSKWVYIGNKQPEPYSIVLWYCRGGRIVTGMYYGKEHCATLPPSHPMHGKSRRYYGKFGRYTEPAESGYAALYWQQLPPPPVDE